MCVVKQNIWFLSRLVGPGPATRAPGPGPGPALGLALGPAAFRHCVSMTRLPSEPATASRNSTAGRRYIVLLASGYPTPDSQRNSHRKCDSRGRPGCPRCLHPEFTTAPRWDQVGAKLGVPPTWPQVGGNTPPEMDPSYRAPQILPPTWWIYGVYSAPDLGRASKLGGVTILECTLRVEIF